MCCHWVSGRSWCGRWVACCGRVVLSGLAGLPIECCLSAQQVGQRDAPPVGGFGVLVFIKVRRLRLAFVSGAPLTVTLGINIELMLDQQDGDNE